MNGMLNSLGTDWRVGKAVYDIHDVRRRLAVVSFQDYLQMTMCSVIQFRRPPRPGSIFIMPMLLLVLENTLDSPEADMGEVGYFWEWNASLSLGIYERAEGRSSSACPRCFLHLSVGVGHAVNIVCSLV
jgi:hypothetical protein